MTTQTLAMTEADLLQAVLDLAAVLKWRTFHARPARTESGWRTAVSGDGVGFPDCVLVRRDRFVVAELKSASGRVSREQSAWIEALDQAGVEVWIWRPEDWTSGLIERTLR